MVISPPKRGEALIRFKVLEWPPAEARRKRRASAGGRLGHAFAAPFSPGVPSGWRSSSDPPFEFPPHSLRPEAITISPKICSQNFELVLNPLFWPPEGSGGSM